MRANRPAATALVAVFYFGSSTFLPGHHGLLRQWWPAWLAICILLAIPVGSMVSKPITRAQTNPPSFATYFSLVTFAAFVCGALSVGIDALLFVTIQRPYDFDQPWLLHGLGWGLLFVVVLPWALGVLAKRAGVPPETEVAGKSWPDPRI